MKIISKIISKNIISCVTVLFLTVSYGSAQQTPVNNFYLQNPFSFNPAATGINGNLTGYIDYSDQFTYLKAAPQVSNAGVHGAITSAMGIGVSFAQQNQGIFSQTAVDLKYSYRLAFLESHTVALGVSLGVMQNKIGMDKVDIPDYSDPALTSNKFNEALLNSGFGVHYNWKAVNVGVSVPVIYGTQEGEFAQTVLALASYDFSFSEGIWKVKPSVFYRFTQKSLHLADINVTAEWNRNVWVQAGYRTNNNILGGAGINIKNLGIGYLYEYDNSKLNVISAGTHQILVQFEFPYSVSKKKPLYLRSSRSSWE